MKGFFAGVVFSCCLTLGYMYLVDKSNVSPQYYFVESTHAFYKRQDGQLSQKSVLFVGDSMIQGLAVSEVYPDSINFGIGTDTIEGVDRRIDEYQVVGNIDCLVIHVGVNDLLFGQSPASAINDMYALLSGLDSLPRVFVGELLPVKKVKPKLEHVAPKILEFNTLLAFEIEKFSNVTLIKQHDVFLNEDGNARKSDYVNDGLHLSTKGNLKWAKHIKSQLLLNNCKTDT